MFTVVSLTICKKDAFMDTAAGVTGRIQTADCRLKSSLIDSVTLTFTTGKRAQIQLRKRIIRQVVHLQQVIVNLTGNLMTHNKMLRNP